MMLICSSGNDSSYKNSGKNNDDDDDDYEADDESSDGDYDDICTDAGKGVLVFFSTALLGTPLVIYNIHF